MKAGRFIKENVGYIVIAAVTFIFSVLTISNSVAGELNYSFPSEGVDYSTISWAEIPLDEKGQEFTLDYKGWDIKQIGIKIYYDNSGDFEMQIKDSNDDKIVKFYSADELFTDSEGLAWLNVNQHVSAGELKITLKNINSEGLRVIGYSQEGILDESGNAALSLNMQVVASSFSKLRAYLFSALWIVIAICGIFILKKRKISFERLFIVLYLLAGVLAFVVYPPFAEPDSGNHYRRAYAISEGDIFPGLDSENAIGGTFSWPSTWGSEDSISVSWYEALNRIAFEVNDSNSERYLTYTNIALYSPLCHIVPAIAMSVARIFSHSIIIIEMVAKIVNFIVIGLLFYLGIKITPFGKEYFLWIIIHPFVMKLYTSISPDAMTAALVYLLTAVVLRIRYDSKVRGCGRYLAILYIIPFLLGQFKIVYITFCLLLFLIPMKKFESKLSYYINAVMIGFITIVPALAWLSMSSHILAMGYSSINSTNKVIAMHIGQYLPILLNTILLKGYDYILQFFGNTLVFKDNTNMGVILAFIMIVSAYVGRNIYKNRHNGSAVAIMVNRDIALKTTLLVTIIITTILIFTAEFVQWTDPGASYINGVSGRYFFPFAFPALILLTGVSDTREIDGDVVKESTLKELFSLIAITLSFVAQLYIVYQL